LLGLAASFSSSHNQTSDLWIGEAQSVDRVQKHFEPVLRTKKHCRCHYRRMLFHPCVDLRGRNDFRWVYGQEGRSDADLLLRYSQICHCCCDFIVDASDLSIQRACKSNDMSHSLRIANVAGRHARMQRERGSRTKLRSNSTDHGNGPTL